MFVSIIYIIFQLNFKPPTSFTDVLFILLNTLFIMHKKLRLFFMVKQVNYPQNNVMHDIVLKKMLVYTNENFTNLHTVLQHIQ